MTTPAAPAPSAPSTPCLYVVYESLCGSGEGLSGHFLPYFGS
jgi:hypothetical protein